MIYLTGDTHGDFRRLSNKNQKKNENIVSVERTAFAFCELRKESLRIFLSLQIGCGISLKKAHIIS